MNLLERIASHATRLEDTQRELRELVAQARAEGHEVTAIAEAARVGRPTVYRWSAMRGGDDRVHVAEAIDTALRIMATVCSHPDQLVGRIGKSLDVQVNGVKMGSKWLPRDLTVIDGDDMEAIKTGIAVAGTAESHRRRYGRWPNMVSLGERSGSSGEAGDVETDG